MPVSIDPSLVGVKTTFVVEMNTAVDIESQIVVSHIFLSHPFNFVECGKRTERKSGVVWVKEEIDAGYILFSKIEDADTDELVVEVVSEFSSVRAGGDKPALIGFSAHVAFVFGQISFLFVSIVEVESLLITDRFCDSNLDVLTSFPDSFL